MSNDILTERETLVVHTINMEDNDMLHMWRSEMNEPTETVTNFVHGSERKITLPRFAMLVVVVGIIAASCSVFVLQKRADIYNNGLYEEVRLSILSNVVHDKIVNGTLIYNMLSHDDKIELMFDDGSSEVCQLSSGDISRVFCRNNVCIESKGLQVVESLGKLNCVSGQQDICHLLGGLACPAVHSLPAALACTEGFLDGMAAVCDASISAWCAITCWVQLKTTNNGNGVAFISWNGETIQSREDAIMVRSVYFGPYTLTHTVKPDTGRFMYWRMDGTLEFTPFRGFTENQYCKYYSFRGPIRAWHFHGMCTIRNKGTCRG
jgi:hypothetical protein